MQISLYNFSKRKNSTAQPGGAAKTVNAELKSNTSLINPVFVLSGTINDSYNYISAFGRYYFINDKTAVSNGLIELSCSCDFLATFKSAIQETSAYVVFDTASNTTVPDSRLNVKSTAVSKVNTGSLRDDTSAAGVCVCTLLSSNQVGSYVIPVGNSSRLMPDWNDAYKDYMDKDDPFSAAGAFIKALCYLGDKATEYIKALKFIPFNVTGDTLVSPLKIGSYSLDIGGHKLTDRNITKSSTIAIPWQFSDWRNNTPYTDLHAYIPFIGHVSLPTTQLIGCSSLVFQSSLDPVTGDLVVTVSGSASDGGAGPVVGMYSANTASDMMIGQTNLSASNIIQGVFQAAGSIAMGSAFGMVGAGLNAIQPVPSSVGGIGSMASVGLDLKVHVITTTHNTAVEPSSVTSIMGTPSGAVKKLGNLTGYVQTAGASVSLQATDTDIASVNSLLDSGIYLE